MLVLYYTHSILFYVGLTNFQSKSKDFFNKLQSFDYEHLPQEVCVAQCLENNKPNVTPTSFSVQNHWDNINIDNNTFLKFCIDNCTLANATKHEQQPTPKQIHENYSLKLVCREDSVLNFNIELLASNKTHQVNVNKSTEMTNTPTTHSSDFFNAAEIGNVTRENRYKTVFVIKMNLASEADKFYVFLSDDNFFTIDKLIANTSYNISVLAVHSNNKYSVIAQQQKFRTLRRSYTPGNVTEIKITHFTEDKFNRMHLTAMLMWKPATDMTCHYDIICFSPESEDYDLQPLEIRNPRLLYKHQLDNLTFSSVYKVGIRACNTKNMRESELFWKTFAVPSCVEWHNYNFNICAPEAPQNLVAKQNYIDQHLYSLNISWQLPTHLPDNYTLRIQDLSMDGETKIYELPKDIHNFYIPQIHFYGIFYEVILTAYTRGGYTKSSLTDITKTVVHIPEKNPLVKLIAVILALIFCVVILFLTIFIIYHRRAKLKRYQERCKYFEDLEKKSPIDPKNSFDLAVNLQTNTLTYELENHEQVLYEDDMEIDRNDLILHQVLGEGAFGLVRLGLYTNKKLGTTQQVAVKMLKDHPSVDDIYAFRREIEVMKSVEKHPNIVGIVGHCTHFSNEMMLVTEYCSFGNLLNFLRDEWKFLHELQLRKQRLDIKTAYIQLNQDEVLSNQDSEDVNSNKPKYNDTQTDNENNEIVQRFNRKYNGTEKTIAFKNGINECNNNNNNDILLHKTEFQYIEDVDQSKTEITTTTPPRRVLLETPNNTSSTANIFSSRIAENKSYGYHGFCTNSCKCDVDVIIKNIHSSDADKQYKELERKQQDSNLNESCGDTTIKIKNCDCKKHKNSRKFKGPIENKSYFTISYLDNKNKLNKNEINQCEQLVINDIKKSHCNTSEEHVGVRDDKLLDESYFNRIPLSNGDLLHIARQVAVGMEFLAKNKVVHRDLAARNVLVAPDRTLKIADFGLSRDVYQDNMYKKTGNGKLPIKWLALESMTHQMYTTKSDVWSYGILLYEIVTLGATPYPSISTNRLLHLLKSGYRMEKPKGCCQEFYDLMYSCWNAEPIERPTFTDILQKIDEMINSLGDHTTQYTEVNKDLNTNEESLQNVPSDDSYLKPL